MSFSLTDEQYARTRISESPLRTLFPSQLVKSESETMPVLDSTAYKNIQTIVAELMIMISKDTVVPLRQIAEVIKIEADNIATAGLDYAYNVIATNQQEEDSEIEVELDDEEELEDKEAGDWNDREEESHAINKTGSSKSLN